MFFTSLGTIEISPGLAHSAVSSALGDKSSDLNSLEIMEIIDHNYSTLLVSHDQLGAALGLPDGWEVTIGFGERITYADTVMAL